MCLIGERLHTDVLNLREVTYRCAYSERGYIPMCLIGESLHTDVFNLREFTYRCA
jgi:predicted HAD superfamily phosphohydrolase YqeG